VAFELAFRKMPATRNYIVAAGITDVLEFLSNLRFENEDLHYLRRSGAFSEPFLRRLYPGR
jgi:nicotinate phosphoribosyltransferase